VLVVIDTNVVLSGLQSSLGASNEVLRRMTLGHFRAAASTALIFEYEDVPHRPGLLPTYAPPQIDAFLDSFCSLVTEAHIYFRWRPFLKDPGDDLIFECALAAGADFIVTHNISDLKAAAQFGISAVTPGRFLHILPPP
jgi:predicted nucleic acid-binding protein